MNAKVCVAMEFLHHRSHVMMEIKMPTMGVVRIAKSKQHLLVPESLPPHKTVSHNQVANVVVHL